MTGISVYIALFIYMLTVTDKSGSHNQDVTIAVEAENYFSQELDEVRKWYFVSSQNDHTAIGPIADHTPTASGNAYLKILPDTRTTHDDSLIRGINFSNQPGELGILNYHIQVQESGRYYVWVRAYSTGTEDNGIHVGIDGHWPESGQRMQWCEGKNQWTWESKQRTLEVHCGEPGLIYLDIDKPGKHVISFSMREDGFEFDKWIMTKEYVKPIDVGPTEKEF